MQSNGVLVWFNDLAEASEVKREILSALQELGIDAYWKVTTFREYEFAKDLLAAVPKRQIAFRHHRNDHPHRRLLQHHFASRSPRQ